MFLAFNWYKMRGEGEIGGERFSELALCFGLADGKKAGKEAKRRGWRLCPSWYKQKSEFCALGENLMRNGENGKIRATTY